MTEDDGSSPGHAGAPGTVLYFMTGFVGAYYLVLWACWRIQQDRLIAHWVMIASFSTRIRTALVLGPLVSVFSSLLLTSVNSKSYLGLGHRVLTPRRVFAFGLVSTLFANWAVVIAFARFAIEKSIGERWVEAVGIERFNFIFNLVAPALAFCAGSIMTVLAANGPKRS